MMSKCAVALALFALANLANADNTIAPTEVAFKAAEVSSTFNFWQKLDKQQQKAAKTKAAAKPLRKKRRQKKKGVSKIKKITAAHIEHNENMRNAQSYLRTVRGDQYIYSCKKTKKRSNSNCLIGKIPVDEAYSHVCEVCEGGKYLSGISREDCKGCKGTGLKYTFTTRGDLKCPGCNKKAKRTVGDFKALSPEDKLRAVKACQRVFMLRRIVQRNNDWETFLTKMDSESEWRNVYVFEDKIEGLEYTKPEPTEMFLDYFAAIRRAYFMAKTDVKLPESLSTLKSIKGESQGQDFESLQSAATFVKNQKTMKEIEMKRGQKMANVYRKFCKNAHKQVTPKHITAEEFLEKKATAERENTTAKFVEATSKSLDEQVESTALKIQVSPTAKIIKDYFTQQKE
jgi:hypothetical protein